MHSWVAFAGLMLLWTEAAVAQARVNGVVGQPVTLPCTYSTARETTSMCWGRGSCPSSQCASQLIWTDGYRVTFQRDRRYTLKGRISQGNVSLTIENAAQSDSGTYCCRVERSGWFNDLKVNILLDVKPAPPKTTRAPTSPRVFTSAPTTAAPMQNLKTDPPKVTSVRTSPRISPWVSTSAPTTTAPTPKLNTAPPKTTSALTTSGVSTSAPATAAPTQKLKPDPPKVTSVPTSRRVSIPAPATAAPTPNLNTAPHNISSVPTFTSASVTPAPTANLTTAPPKARSAPTSPRVLISAPTTPAPTRDILRETASSSPVQTAETQPNTPQGTNTTSSSSHCGPTDGNSTVMQPSEGGWQDSGNHVNLEENPWMSRKALSIGLSTAALMLLSVLAAVVTRRYFCVNKMVFQVSKPSSIELLTGPSQNETAVHYQGDENVHFENNLYNEH